MKWDKNRKTNRNNEIRDIHKRRPELSMKEIGEMFQITKQRVWAILKGER